MRQVDIEHLFLLLAKYQVLDPKIAKVLLQRILQALQEIKRSGTETQQPDREESVEQL